MGIEGLLHRGQDLEARAEGAGEEASAVEADAVVVADGRPAAMVASVTASQARW